MIVAVHYQFHDNPEGEDFIVNTLALDTNHLFESDLKKALEGKKKFVQMDGDKYMDDWGNLGKAKVNAQMPIAIDAQRSVHVFFDC